MQKNGYLYTLSGLKQFYSMYFSNNVFVSCFNAVVLPMLKTLVAMSTNTLKIWLINLTHKLDPVIAQKVLKLFL
jgi:hypothetical protein